ncbi:MAG: stage II sporulation protein D [Clostridiales bacterium]|nr:stage II sporulation protein D [Clostridiales bacterium]
MDDTGKKEMEKRYSVDFKRLLLILGALLLCVLLLQSCILSCAKGQQTNNPAESAPLGVGLAAQDIRCSAPKEPAGQASLPPTVALPLVPLEPIVVVPTPAPARLIRVYYHREDALRETDLEVYLVGVLAGEMPNYFHEQALMAQAVAARTYTLYRANRGGCGGRDDADICTNSQCCQAYQSAETLRARWGDDYDANMAKLQAAVFGTRGQVITYKGKPIEALYHAGSGGRTEDSELVYAIARPYLRSVESANEIGGRQENSKEIPFAQFAETVNAAYPKAKLSPDRDALLSAVRILSLSGSDRVLQIQLGEVTLTGKQCRRLFTLDSTLFTIAFTENTIVFSTRGHGHGVGLSQSGANGMAQSGATWEEILLHYYTGVEISNG